MATYTCQPKMSIQSREMKEGRRERERDALVQGSWRIKLHRSAKRVGALQLEAWLGDAAWRKVLATPVVGFPTEHELGVLAFFQL